MQNCLGHHTIKITDNIYLDITEKKEDEPKQSAFLSLKNISQLILPSRT
ncbi:hypothetical protein [Gottfriedia sp. OAE603]